MEISKVFTPSAKVDSEKESRLSLFYVNDMHGNISRLPKLKTAYDEFKKQNEQNPKMFLAAGDCLFGTDKKLVSLFIKFFNKLKLDMLTLGNHEFAGGIKKLAENLKDAKFKTAACNLEFGENSPLRERIKDKKLVKSAVFMKGGHKFAVIGAAPFDSYIGTGEKSDVKTSVKNLQGSIDAINQEAKKYENQGINKIILCSHLGYENDLKVANSTEGIDVIVGGHSHTKIDGINSTNKEGNNKLNLLSSKRNEPVLITQTGYMNSNAGYADLIFDEKGVLNLEKTTNKLVPLSNLKDDFTVKPFVERVLGNDVVLADVHSTYTPKNSIEERFKENPLHNMISDALLDSGKKLGAKVSLYNSSTARGGFNNNISVYDVKYRILPFNTSCSYVEISESDVVDMLNSTIKLFEANSSSAILLRTAGMTYNVLKKPFQAENGKMMYVSDVVIDEKPVNINHPDENNKIGMVVNDYLFDHEATKNAMAKYRPDSKVITYLQESFIDYLKKKKDIYPPKEEVQPRIKIDGDLYGQIH